MERTFHVLPHAMTIGEYLTWSTLRCAREQRDYQWQKEQVETFCRDILDFVQGLGRGDALPIYFVGQTILSRQSGDLLIFDGLQRTTTLTLIVAWLRDRISDETAKARLAACIDDGKGGYRLVLPGNDDALVRLAQEDGATARPNVGGRRFGRTLAIENNLRAIDTVLSALSHERDRINFADVLLNRVELVALQIPNGMLAERMFSKINGTGLRLSPYDLVKSRLIEFAKSDDEARKFVDVWDRVRNIVHRDFDQFLHDAFATARPDLAPPGGVPNLETLLMWAKARHSRDDRGLFDWLRFLERAAADWMALNQVVRNGVTRRTELKQLLPLWAIDTYEWRPFALAVYSRYGSEERRTDKQKRVLSSIFAKLQSRVALMKFGGVRDGTRSRIFENAIRDLRSGVEPERVVDELLVRDAWIAHVRRLLHEPITDAQLRRSLFQYLELQTAPSVLSLRPNKSEAYSIEHVLPVTPLEGSRWLEDFPDADERSRLTDLIGNFMGVPYAVNEQLGRRDFDEKRAILDAGTGPWRNWVTAQGVVEMDRWTRDVIEARTQKLGLMIWDTLNLPDGHVFAYSGDTVMPEDGGDEPVPATPFSEDEQDFAALFDQQTLTHPEPESGVGQDAGSKLHDHAEEEDAEHF